MNLNPTLPIPIQDSQSEVENRKSELENRKSEPVTLKSLSKSLMTSIASQIEFEKQTQDRFVALEERIDAKFTSLLEFLKKGGNQAPVGTRARGQSYTVSSLSLGMYSRLGTMP